MRLDKLLAHTGFGTRKEVKKIIKDKYITVNGEIVRDPGTKVDPDVDDVRVGGTQIFYEEFVYYMLNKPAGVISATEDFVHETVLDLLDPSDIVQEPHPVGRLDIDTEGLLILTNDGQLTHQLTSPKKAVDKEYYAEIAGIVTKEDIEKFKEGLYIDDDIDEAFTALPAQLEIIDIIEEDNASVIHVTVQEGKFHQVKRMFQAVDKEVTYLKRIRMKALKLDDRLQYGEYRRLTDEEVALLKE